MGHVYHERAFPNPLDGLGQQAEPILFDDCPRCEEHAATPLYSLDSSFTRALWQKMVSVEKRGEGDYRSGAEAQACKLMYAVAVFLERNTSVNPWALLGELRAA